jgi:peroxiredoxin Q/BCP
MNKTEDISPINVGDSAPDFTFETQDKRKVTLSSLRGRIVVLYFYPKDFTPGCTREACDFRDNYGDLKQVGAVVLGISPDTDDSHRKFTDKYELSFTLLTDPDHKVLEAYGAWGMKEHFGRETEGVIRSTVLIDSRGIIHKIWKSVQVEGHVEQVLADVRKLRA